MNLPEIIAANRASAAEQAEQDERNELAKADMAADRLVNVHPPHSPLYFREETKEDFLREIEAENIKQSRT